MAPVQGRSALSQVLDVVEELQNTNFGTANMPEYSESRVSDKEGNREKLEQSEG